LACAKSPRATAKPNRIGPSAVADPVELLAKESLNKNSQPPQHYRTVITIGKCQFRSIKHFPWTLAMSHHLEKKVIMQVVRAD